MTSRYTDSVSCTYQGLAYVFARDTQAGDPSTLVFNVLNLRVGSRRDDDDWTGFQPIAFPDQVRPVGMSLIQAPVSVSPLLAAAAAPFRVVSDDTYLYLLRPSAGGTLLVNRMRAVRQFDVDAQAERFSIVPAWEVRFRQSGKVDVPGSDHDVQSYLGPGGEPFLEPTLELSFVDGIRDGRFDALLVPGAQGPRWHLFAPDVAAGTLRHWSIAWDALEVFRLPETGDTAPADVVALRTHDGKALAPAGAPTAALYARREPAVTAQGDEVSAQRAARVGLAQPVRPEGGAASVAWLDLGVGVDGELVRVPARLELPAIQPANYTLDFDRYAFVGLPNQGGTLALAGAFDLELWVRPSAVDGPAVQQILGDEEPDAAKRAVFLEMVDGGRVAVGFGTGSEAVRAETEERVVRQNAWSRLQASFAPGAPGTLSLRVNGRAVALRDASTGAKPGGAPVTRVSRAEAGFVGRVDQLVIRSGGTVVAQLPFDSVDFVADPPTTPDTSGKGNTGSVHGARLVPSDAPVVAGRNGALHIDPAGLRLYYGVLDFLRPGSDPFLLPGKDGLLHLYFQGPAEGAPGLPRGFDVAQHDTRTARAAFAAPWRAAPAGVEAQAGQVIFVSRLAGAFMNEAKVEVTVPPPPAGQDVPDLCDLEFTLEAAGSTELARERWTGVPRRLQDLEAVLNGLATAEPDDPALQAGSRPFFDPRGRYALARVPLEVEQRFAFLNFSGRHPGRLPLRRVEIAAADDAWRSVVLRFEVLKEAWPEPRSCVQSWNRLPPQAGELQRVLNGVSETYDYAGSASSSLATGGIETAARQGTGRIAVLVHPSLSALRVGVEDGAEPALCTVRLAGKVGDTAPAATLRGVPRQQAAFAAVLDGTSDGYDYGANAEGEWRALTARLLPFAEAVEGQVLNRPADRGLAPADMRAGASLFALFQSGGPAASAIVPAPFARDADQRTGAVDGVGAPLVRGSRLFATAPVAPPLNGGAPLVGSTADTGGAARIVSGVDGGWIRQPPQKALGFAGGGEVGFDVAASTADALFLDRHMTLEAWFSPAAPDPALRLDAPQRILTFHRKGRPGDPGALSRYALGAAGSYTLRFDARAYAAKGIDPIEQVASLELWVRPAADGRGEAARLYGDLVNQPVLSLSLDQGKLRTAYFGAAVADVPAVALPADRWSYVVATLAREQDQVQVRLFVDGEARGQATLPHQDGKVGGIAVGLDGQTANGMAVNGVSLWTRALWPDEVRTGYLRSLPDSAPELLIRWKFTEGAGAVIRNYASSGLENDVTVSKATNTKWTGPGVYTTFHFARGDQALAGAAVNSTGRWRHLAATCRCGTALLLDGRSGAEARFDDSLNAPDAFSAEVWIQPTEQRGAVLASHPGAYTLRTNANGTLEALFQTTHGPLRLTSAVRVAPGELAYLAATFVARGVPPERSTGEAPPQKWVAECALYVNGVQAATARREVGEPIRMSAPRTGLWVGREGESGGFAGWLGELRLWRRVLEKGEVATAFATRTAPASTDGLISSWSFAEMEGRVASDHQRLNRLLLSSERLWNWFEPLSEMALLVDAEPAGAPGRLSPAAFGGYGDAQLTFARCKGAAAVVPLRGQLDEVRIWSVPRTREQVEDSAFRPLAGNEEGLAGYWRFDAGSGDRVEDGTGRGADGRIVFAAGSPAWGVSRAPLSNEAGEVFNVLGGVRTDFNQAIAGPPTAVEYGDVQLDAFGRVISVLKRLYVAPQESGLMLNPGYMVGELETVYVGQAQTRPSVIGYIEGAPPIPSENQTAPYWDSGFSEYHHYADASSVSLALAEEATVTLQAGTTSGGAFAFAGKGGLAGGTTLGASAGIGWEADWGFFDVSLHLGVQGSVDQAWNTGNERSLAVGRVLSSASELAPGGDWEPADRLLNPEVGRRYVPENTGYALVKSGVADLFASRLRSDGTLVRLTATPNLEIPEDVNILTFPIDPLHVRNGSLDGQVGLVKDPATRQSYFRPLEAYALKRAVERKQQQVQAYYDQFSPSAYARPDGYGRLQDASRDNPSFDWGRRLSQRAVANTYVWTAAGGTYAEETSFADSYSETYGALASTDSAVGLAVDFEIKAFVGLYGELDFLWHTTVELTASKSREEEHTVELRAQATPDGYLARPLVEGDKVAFTPAPAPGKVDAYRYMAFYLPPDAQHFADFFGEVVDPQWLAESQSPQAVALREASVATNGCWRVRYYVTYVSRVPPAFQPVPDEFRAPAVQPPPNLAQNVVLRRLVDASLPEENGVLDAPGLTELHPSPAQVGAAVRAVLGTGPEQPGELARRLPWWKDYLARAADYADPASLTMESTRDDVLAYMSDDYETRVLRVAGRRDVRLLAQRR